MERNQQILLILTSPPASGKTYWIESLLNEVGSGEVLIISPLRALADECSRKWGDKVNVLTPEKWMSTQPRTSIVIFDEFHLNFFWGDSFRPLLWEVFYDLASSASLTILLTATLRQEMFDEIEHFNSQFDQIIWKDHGNQKLKFTPEKYFHAPSKRWVEQLIMMPIKAQGTRLVFCQYREEVRYWHDKLQKAGHTVWTCVGGEAKEFSLRTGNEPAPDFIVATTVLSHGVNLPDIKTIYFLYELKNQDFWIQMVARGGRRGEKYSVYSLEKPYDLKWNFWTNLFAITVLSLKMKFHHEKEELSRWFMKA